MADAPNDIVESQPTALATPADPPVPPAPAAPPPPLAAASTQPSAPVASNAQPGIDLESGERVDDASDVAKRDARVQELASQYDDPEQRQRVYDKFEVDTGGTSA